ncbi:MAG: ABC transporter substrate-binding protein [Alphaproteobacteria bacterium]
MLPLSIAVADTDRIRPLADGRVAVAGCTATVLRLEVEELMFRGSRGTEFDVCELALGAYLGMLDRGDCPYVALPVFPARAFRHNCIYVRAGIDRPEQLRGRRIGVPDWTLTTAIWARGLLSDEYGLALSEIDWLCGGLEQPDRAARVPSAVPDCVTLTALPPGRTLSGMLAAGEIDAVIASRPPSCVARGLPGVGRLFADWATAERAWWDRHRIFPIQHAVMVRRALLAAHPWLGEAMQAAFETAKTVAQDELRQADPAPYSLPWLGAAVEEAARVFGADPWPYGVEANRTALAMLCRLAQAQGVTRRLFTVDELFDTAMPARTAA